MFGVKMSLLTRAMLALSMAEATKFPEVQNMQLAALDEHE